MALVACAALTHCLHEGLEVFLALQLVLAGEAHGGDEAPSILQVHSSGGLAVHYWPFYRGSLPSFSLSSGSNINCQEQ